MAGRVLKRLEEDGAVLTQGRSVVIRDDAQLSSPHHGHTGEDEDEDLDEHEHA
jgi:hypothetical protein